MIIYGCVPLYPICRIWGLVWLMRAEELSSETGGRREADREIEISVEG